ncbi:MAG: hypothetical protein E6K94_04130 [Thaumarchaeota archaeon]|nr:MAG: hypothetical protein E6L01_03595 [Nitrososphaerota archaeon]TLX91216.1 MAG: hypothetical protein E6K94_04130 [Nitrososphaerota archaeon]
MINRDNTINPEKVLSQTLDELRITDNKIIQNTSSLVKNLQISNDDEFWINIMKAIVVICDENKYLFSKAELCDFLTIGARGLDNKKYETKVSSENQFMNKVVSDAIFSIYKDIMENYDNVDNDLKYYYPKIILNVISIIRRGSDISGEKVNLYGLERYYLKNKHDAINKKLDISEPIVSVVQKADNAGEKKLSEVSSLQTLIPASVKENTLSKKDLVNSLSVITGRKKNELNELLTRIPEQDYKKITDLCINYSKLQKYSKLIGTEEFSRQIEKELGRKFNDRQLQHATISIRKVKTYVENVLEGKFVPHGSHGINHVKHNLEYGYQLMGLIEYRRRKYSH